MTSRSGYCSGCFVFIEKYSQVGDAFTTVKHTTFSGYQGDMDAVMWLLIFARYTPRLNYCMEQTHIVSKI